ncbi:hypothetical protein CRG98_017941 [Punica granatum]|uniref:Uncharacterized protein n=1 Tax=Punica granatum TaxID=22663 RepID=A0A2I0JZG1_PUNGR|nr:hypothetical protein CRG98_017941 [Punica granatum]
MPEVHGALEDQSDEVKTLWVGKKEDRGLASPGHVKLGAESLWDPIHITCQCRTPICLLTRPIGKCSSAGSASYPGKAHLPLNFGPREPSKIAELQLEPSREGRSYSDGSKTTSGEHARGARRPIPNPVGPSGETGVKWDWLNNRRKKKSQRDEWL